MNNTGYTLLSGYMKESKDLWWGNNRLISSLPNGSSRTITLSKPISEANVYDFVFSTQTSSTSGDAFRRWSVTITDGMTVTINDSHFTNGGEQQTVRVLNRVGRECNVLSIWPSDGGGVQWSGTFSNNNDPTTLTIAMPRSVGTTFNFQIKSANPEITYTKKDVTLPGNNTQIMFTTADSDIPLTEYRPVIVIQNNTGSQLVYTYIKPAGSEDWGPDLLSINLSDGGSYAFTLGALLSVQDKYDIRVKQMFDNYVKWNVTVTDGMVVTFDSADKY